MITALTIVLLLFAAFGTYGAWVLSLHFSAGALALLLVGAAAIYGAV